MDRSRPPRTTRPPRPLRRIQPALRPRHHVRPQDRRQCQLHPLLHAARSDGGPDAPATYQATNECTLLLAWRQPLKHSSPHRSIALGIGIRGPLRHRSIVTARSRRSACRCGSLTVLVGGNGVGKTNLYRALQLLHAAAHRQYRRRTSPAKAALARSCLGRRPQGPRAAPVLVAAVDFDTLTDGSGRLRWPRYDLDLGFPPSYEVDIGFPMPEGSPPPSRPKPRSRPSRSRSAIRQSHHALMERKGPAVWARDNAGKRESVARIACSPAKRLSEPARRPYPKSTPCASPSPPGASSTASAPTQDSACAALRSPVTADHARRRWQQPRRRLRNPPPYPPG
jgi:hypothetical protein